jgi:hypothetical protein
MSEYTHPASGRVYEEGDPAHRFAVLAAGLARQCETFLHHYRERMADTDYLDQHTTWPSDPGRIARAMSDTLAAVEQAYTDVIVDRDAHEYGLGTRDDEWTRKYGRNPT